ncbi:MmgE/PrpD family protein [Chloroflexota bacterium]
MQATENVTGILADFAARIKYEDLPPEITRELKRVFLDLCGCALLGYSVDKGKISVAVAGALGGQPESTILGTGKKVSTTNAAFANGELMNALDYDTISPPGHTSSFVIPAALALAERERASGKSLLTALAIAHEVAIRVASALPSARSGKEYSERPGGMGACTFGAAAGASKILAFDRESMANALGLAGGLTPLPILTKWHYSPFNAMFKYSSSGWIAQCGVMGALLTQKGYLGDHTILDGPYGFWNMYGADECKWEKMTADLGQQWEIMRIAYKQYPIAGIHIPSLEAFAQIIETQKLNPDDIEKVVVKGEPRATYMPSYNVDEFKSHMDVQFNGKYGVAMIAHRVNATDWQAEATMNDPKIRDFMKKVDVEPFPKFEESRYREMVTEGQPYIIKRPAFAEVIAKGQSFTAEVEYPKWGPQTIEKLKVADSELIQKFKANASRRLPGSKSDKAIELIFGLEKLDDISGLMEALSV